MIFTVFCTTADPQAQWQAELLEYSWGRARQPGELVRLVAAAPGDALPRHRLARVVPTLSWSPHPFNRDRYPPYDTAASVLEWLFTERVDGTVLLVGESAIFRLPIAREAERGTAHAMAWPGLPRGDGPFGLGPGFRFLDACCVDRSLALAAVKLPLLIHSSDLRRLAARWLEMMSIIRVETNVGARGPRDDADAIAYAIAAAEAGVAHTVVDFAIGNDASDGAEPIVAEFEARRAEGADLAFLRPCPHPGVREGRILGQLFLEIPGRSDTLTLNASGAAIWGLCDGVRSLAEVNRDLEARFAMPAGSLRGDVAAVIERLEGIGALRLRPV